MHNSTRTQWKSYTVVVSFLGARNANQALKPEQEKTAEVMVFQTDFSMWHTYKAVTQSLMGTAEFKLKLVTKTFLDLVKVLGCFYLFLYRLEIDLCWFKYGYYIEGLAL